MSSPGLVQRTTYADQVAVLILDLTRERGLAPGAEIPTESELAARFGVNRLAVREAIRILVAQELLVSSQGRPARVAVPSGRMIGRILQARLQHDALELADVVQTRQVVEGHLAGRAALRVAAGDPLDPDAERQLALMQDSLDDRDRFIAADIAFHRAITDFGDNSLLQLFLDAVQDVLLATRQASWEGRQRAGGGHTSTLQAHSAILAAVKAGDGAAAERAMTDHLTATSQDLAVPIADGLPPRRGVVS